MLAAALTGYRTLLATAALTGLRLSELLGLVWSEVDFDAGVIRVRKQLDRKGVRVSLKSPGATRDVVMVDSLASLLRVERDRARAARPVPLDRERDFVFATLTGGPRSHRNVEVRGLEKAAERAGLVPVKVKRKRGEDAPRRAAGDAADTRTLRFHDLRHGFASMLIASGADVVFVSRQLGHADPAITLRVYAHLFAAHQQADRTRRLLEGAVGNVLETSAVRDGSPPVPVEAVIPLNRAVSGSGGD